MAPDFVDFCFKHGYALSQKILRALQVLPIMKRKRGLFFTSGYYIWHEQEAWEWLGEVLWWSVTSQGTVFHLTSGSSVSYLIRSGWVAQSSIELDLKISPPARGTSLFIAGEKSFFFSKFRAGFLDVHWLRNKSLCERSFNLLTINYLKMVSRTSLFVLPSLYNYYK